jgi:hypothetical protein
MLRYQPKKYSFNPPKWYQAPKGICTPCEILRRMSALAEFHRASISRAKNPTTGEGAWRMEQSAKHMANIGAIKVQRFRRKPGTPIFRGYGEKCQTSFTTMSFWM